MMQSLTKFGQIALLVGGLLAGWYAPSLLNTPNPQPLGYILICAALLAFAILAAQISQIEITRSLRIIRLDLLALIGGSVLAGIAIALTPLTDAKPWPILIIWVGGWASILFGAWMRDRTATIAPQQRFAIWEIYAIAGLSIVALLARGIQIDHIPFSVHGDEGEMGLIARSVLQGRLSDPFVTAFLDHPALWFFLQAIALRLFGNTIGGLRFLSALIGTATIPICYLFARDLFGRRVALIATILLVGYHFHIHFSRIALNNIVDPLLALIAFTAFMRGWRNGSALGFALAGTAAGLAQHFYMGGRLIPVIIGALLLHQALFDRPMLRARWRGVLLMSLATLAAFGPLLRFFLEHPIAYMARIQAAGLFQTGRAAEQLAQGWSMPALLLDQANRAFGAYLYTIDTGLFYAPPGPLLDPIYGTLFLCGIGIAVVGITRLDRFLPLAWIAGTAIFGGMILIDPPQSPRYVIATPAICVLIACGLNLTALLLRKLTLPARIVDATLGMVSIALAISSLFWYFWVYTPQLRYGGTRDLTTIAYYIHNLPPNRYVFFLGAPYAYKNHGAITFLADGHADMDIIEPLTAPDQVPAPPPGMHPIFIALSARSSEIAIVQERYPGGNLTNYVDPIGILNPLLTIYEAP